MSGQPTLAEAGLDRAYTAAMDAARSLPLAARCGWAGGCCVSAAAGDAGAGGLHLDAVGPALRELAQEPVEVGDEVTAMRVVGRPEPGKLEHQEADGRSDGLAGLQERLRKQIRVQEILVGLASLLAEPVQVRVFLGRDRGLV